MRRILVLLVACLLVEAQEDEQHCNDANCKRPECYCRTQELPVIGVNPNITDQFKVPQFVMLTFDDAVNANNIDFYRELIEERKNPGNCPIRATFFVTHEYNNYMYLNELYKKGHEIASHSITHSSNTDEWREKSKANWTEEMSGMRDLIVKYARIPKTEIRGIRAPFLQTSGDKTFEMLKEQKFLYDSSMATRTYSEIPMWPYTLDMGFDQDCVIDPCPEGNYPGLWEVPLVSFWKERIIIPGQKPQMYPCAMVDACLPYPETAQDTKNYLMENFDRHYKKNRAPFPIFLHEAWLKNPERKNGYIKFVDELLKKYKDVFFVTVNEVIEYMKKPIPLDVYRVEKCRTLPGGTDCTENRCLYRKPIGFESERIMFSCVKCPKTYPWIKNINP